MFVAKVHFGDVTSVHMDLCVSLVVPTWKSLNLQSRNFVHTTFTVGWPQLSKHTLTKKLKMTCNYLMMWENFFGFWHYLWSYRTTNIFHSTKQEVRLFEYVDNIMHELFSFFFCFKFMKPVGQMGKLQKHKLCPFLLCVSSSIVVVVFSKCYTSLYWSFIVTWEMSVFNFVSYIKTENER